MNDKYAKLDKLMTMTLADKLKLVEEIISAPLEEQVISDLNNEGYRLQNVGKKETFLKGAGIFFFALFLTFNSYGQTIDDVAIGAVLASMPTGVTLRDGTVLKAEVISLGTAAASYTNHGIYNQYDFGGIFNGVNDGLTTPTGPDGNTIVGYTGSKDPLNFTRINADPRTDIDRGDATNFGNAIGFHFWSDRPIIAKELLLIDCDGFTGGSNREWFTLFGYNGTTAVNPTISLHTATELVQGLETVNTSWYTLVNSKITGTVASFTQKRIAKNSTGTTGDNDPDDRGIQALFDFGTNKVTDLFVLWGVRGDLGAATGSQNSGVSPLVFSFEFDYGDAPNSYGTNKASNGPVHVVPTTPLLSLGTTVTTENNGTPGALATGDTDDGVATIDSVLGVATLSDVITTYSLTTSYSNTTGLAANYAAWIDWNNNGVFDAGEGKTASTLAGSTSGTVTFTWTSQTLARASLTDVNTYARIRMTTEAITTANATNSPFQNGEVEDYLIPFAAPLPLPIHLLSFNATVFDNREVMLKWSVADQKNVQQYTILRSTDGVTFTTIGTVDATDANSYSTLDKKPMQGVNLYKLNTVDFDGIAQVSAHTLSVTLGSENQILVLYPNPADNFVNINTQGYGPNISLVVYNAMGQMELRKSLVSGMNAVDVRLWKSGVYSFRLFDQNTEISSSRVNISH